MLIYISYRQREFEKTTKVLLTNRDELLFLTVFAFPKASKRGLDFKITSLTCSAVWPPPETADKYSMINFAATVLPAPDSPLKIKFM